MFELLHIEVIATCD